MINLLYKRKEGEFEDNKGVIRIRKSKKNRQHNGQKKKGQKEKQQSTNYDYLQLRYRSSIYSYC